MGNVRRLRKGFALDLLIDRVVRDQKRDSKRTNLLAGVQEHLSCRCLS